MQRSDLFVWTTPRPGRARAVIQALLHAAAPDQLPTRTLFKWLLSATAATARGAISDLSVRHP
jgi:hypothetical protein